MPSTASRDDAPAVVLARDRPAPDVRGAAGRGELRRIGRGVYVAPRAVAASAAEEQTPHGDARALAIAHAHGTHRRLTADHVFSHATAALLWGLPLWRAPQHTSVLVRHSAGRGADRRVVRRVGLPSDDDVVLRHGLPVTSLDRTMVDCARVLAPLDALVVADAAVRKGAARDVALAQMVVARGRGVVQAREIVRLADAGAESPGESATRFVVLRDGLPVPTTQLGVRTRLGSFWTDLGWPALRLALEYDGRTKYTDPEVLVREKRRHDAMVEAGWTVLRVTKEDLPGPTLTRRVLRALPAHSHPPLTPRRALRGG